MWEDRLDREPFDLRLTALRLLRCLGPIALVTALGSILFGGGYYIRKSLLVEPRYAATITCKINYTDPPTKSGDYYINATTWNTYVTSQEFNRLVLDTDAIKSMDSIGENVISADVPSDIQVPTFTVTGPLEGQVRIWEEAVAEVVAGPWAARLPEVASIEIIDMGPVGPVTDEFYRPARAFVFGGILACFFGVILFLLREICADSIWLPATLRKRYGLMAVGTVYGRELAENIRYAFLEKTKPMKKIAMCAVDDKTDPNEALESLREQKALQGGQDWMPMPAPCYSPEAVRSLREADGVLLIVPAGLHAGKPLERTLEFLAEQDVKITAALLWEADEKLIRAYYGMKGAS